MKSSAKPEVHNIAMPPEKDRATATGNMHRKLRGEVWTSSF